MSKYSKCFACKYYTLVTIYSARCRLSGSSLIPGGCKHYVKK